MSSGTIAAWSDTGTVEPRTVTSIDGIATISVRSGTQAGQLKVYTGLYGLQVTTTTVALVHGQAYKLRRKK
jgi:hypothetical protein